MTIRKYFYALPAMAALLLTASCSNQENEMIEAPQPAKTRIIPYTVQVNDNSDTRLTLNEDKKYTFEKGDKLYIWGSGGEGEDAWTVGGELDWEKDYSFSGSVAVTGEPSDVTVNVIVKGKNDQLLPATFKEFAEGGYETDIVFPADAIAADAKEAVGKYSLISGDGPFSEKFYIVSQRSSFIEFDITLEDGTAADEALAVSITSDDETIRSGASVTTINVDGAIKAKFVVPFDSYLPLKNATVYVDTSDKNTGPYQKFTKIIGASHYFIKTCIDKSFGIFLFCRRFLIVCKAFNDQSEEADHYSNYENSICSSGVGKSEKNRAGLAGIQ